MDNVPDIICKRLCIHKIYNNKCGKPREWKSIDENDLGWGHYCVERFPDTCKEFEFDDRYIPLCLDCTICANWAVWLGIQPCKHYKRKWWKFWRPK